VTESSVYYGSNNADNNSNSSNTSLPSLGFEGFPSKQQIEFSIPLEQQQQQQQQPGDFILPYLSSVMDNNYSSSQSQLTSPLSVLDMATTDFYQLFWEKAYCIFYFVGNPTRRCVECLAVIEGIHCVYFPS
jgi:hypothetical protein